MMEAHTEKKLMSEPTQTGRLYRWMKNDRPITQATAWRDLGIMRLSPRILELKRLGAVIEDRWVEVSNQYSETCNIKEYRLAVEDKRGQELGLGLVTSHIQNGGY